MTEINWTYVLFFPIIGAIVFNFIRPRNNGKRMERIIYELKESSIRQETLLQQLLDEVKFLRTGGR